MKRPIAGVLIIVHVTEYLLRVFLEQIWCTSLYIYIYIYIYKIPFLSKKRRGFNHWYIGDDPLWLFELPG